MAPDKREAWLEPPLEGLSDFLNPVAATLIQIYRELEAALKDFNDDKLWIKPLGMASVGFHLNHLKGVLDRLFTYAKGHSLSEEQFIFLNEEANKPTTPVNSLDLLENFHLQIKLAIDQLKSTPTTSLNEARKVGRKGLTCSLIGLYFHAAEHSSRHLGQLLVTIRLLKE
jgi:hypothetical protein